MYTYAIIVYVCNGAVRLVSVSDDHSDARSQGSLPKVAEGWASGGCAIHWRRDGTRGLPLLLMHEMGGSLVGFDAVVDALAEASFTILRMDQRGFGLSEKPREGYAFSALVTDVEAVLDAAGVTGPVGIVAVAASTA